MSQGLNLTICLKPEANLRKILPTFLTSDEVSVGHDVLLGRGEADRHGARLRGRRRRGGGGGGGGRGGGGRRAGRADEGAEAGAVRAEPRRAGTGVGARGGKGL